MSKSHNTQLCLRMIACSVVVAILLFAGILPCRAQAEIAALGPQKIKLFDSSSAASVPINWILYRNGKSLLSFDVAYHSGSAGAGTTPLLASLNFAGNTRFLSTSTLTSGLYLDLRGGEWLNRSGVNLIDKTRVRNAEASITFSRAGWQFNPGTSGLTPGKQVEEFVTTLHPLSALSISTNLRETTLLANPAVAGSSAGTTTLEGVAFALNLPQNTHIQAGRTETTVNTAGSPQTSSTVDTVKLDSALPGHTQISADYTSTAAATTAGLNGASSTYTQNSSLQVTSKAIDQVSITGSVKSALAGSSTTNVGAVDFEATPFHKDKRLAKVKVKASAQATAAGTGDSSTESASVEIPDLPFAKTSLTGGITHSSDTARSSTVGSLEAASKPNKFVELDEGVKLRDVYLSSDSPDPDAFNSYNFKVLFGPSRLLKFTGSYSANPENTAGSVQHAFAHSLGIESDLKLFKVTGQYGYQQDLATARLSNNLKLGVDVRLTPRDLLSTAWEGSSVLDSTLSETSICRLGYTHKLGSTVDLSLSGSLTQNFLNGVAAPNSQELKAEAKIGLHF